MSWGRLSRAERDAAYNNSDAVADSPALVEARTAASARFRATVKGALDLPYGPGERQRWDLFPADDPAAPCFVFIHGGYWQRGRREDFCCLGEGLRAHGWSVALPGYDAEIAALSPLRLPPVGKPMAIAYGTRELAALVDDSRDLNALRAAAHCPGALVPVAGTDHFTILDTLRVPDGVLVRAAIDALA